MVRLKSCSIDICSITKIYAIGALDHIAKKLAPKNCMPKELWREVSNHPKDLSGIMVTHKLPGFVEAVLQHSGLRHCRVSMAPDGVLGQSAGTGPIEDTTMGSVWIAAQR